MEILYKLKEKDMINFQFFALKKLKRWNWGRFFIKAILISFLVSVIILFVNERLDLLLDISLLRDTMLFLNVTIAFLTIIIIRYLIKFAKKQYKDIKNDYDIRYILEEDKFYEKTKNTQTSLAYEKIKSISQTEENFFIMIGDMLGYILTIMDINL
ncbi:MAG: hypothetical protein CSA86_06145 [Arcobacter sp.]|nr:MAG: hypothetical protein CSA86_06145 [Arcobacter sp.]